MTATFTLVIENSMPRASLATIGLGGHLEQREFTSDRSHNAVLFSPLQELLDARDWVIHEPAPTIKNLTRMPSRCPISQTGPIVSGRSSGFPGDTACLNPIDASKTKI